MTRGRPSLSPTAQTSVADTAVTPCSSVLPVGGVIAARVQALPFQCRASATLPWSPTYQPTAHASVAESADTPCRVLPYRPGLGVVMRDHFCPSQPSTSVSGPGLSQLEYDPTAQARVLDTAATSYSRSAPGCSVPGGAAGATAAQDAPSQCRRTGPRPLLSPTAQTSPADTALTPSSSPEPVGVAGTGTSVQAVPSQCSARGYPVSFGGCRSPTDQASVPLIAATSMSVASVAGCGTLRQSGAAPDAAVVVVVAARTAATSARRFPIGCTAYSLGSEEDAHPSGAVVSAPASSARWPGVPRARRWARARRPPGRAG